LNFKKYVTGKFSISNLKSLRAYKDFQKKNYYIFIMELSILSVLFIVNIKLGIILTLEQIACNCPIP